MSRAAPEGRWIWRRLYVYGLTLGLWLSLQTALERAEGDELRALTEGVLGLLGLVMVLYLVAPSVQQMLALIASVKLRLGLGAER